MGEGDVGREVGKEDLEEGLIWPRILVIYIVGGLGMRL